MYCFDYLSLTVKQEVLYIPIERAFMSLWYGLAALITTVSKRDSNQFQIISISYRNGVACNISD